MQKLFNKLCFGDKKKLIIKLYFKSDIIFTIDTYWISKPFFFLLNEGSTGFYSQESVEKFHSIFEICFVLYSSFLLQKKLIFIYKKNK